MAKGAHGTRRAYGPAQEAGALPTTKISGIYSGGRVVTASAPVTRADTRHLTPGEKKLFRSLRRDNAWGAHQVDLFLTCWQTVKAKHGG